MQRNNFKYLSDDIVFKYIFGCNENIEFTQRFLELYFNVPIGSLNDIEILNSVKLIPKNINIKTLEMDVLVKIPSLNIIVILEMQKKLNYNAFVKNVLYLFSQIVKCFKRGEKNFTNGPKVILINLVKHICGDYEEEIYNLMGRISKKIALDELFEIENINLAKYDAKCYNKNIEELKMWYALMNANTEEGLNEIWKRLSRFPLIRKVVKNMKAFNDELYGNDYWLNELYYNSELESRYDEGHTTGFNEGRNAGFNEGRNAGFNEGRNAGFDEGRNAGFDEGKYETAKKLLEYTNTSVEDISKCTELSLEEVKKLKEERNILIKK